MVPLSAPRHCQLTNGLTVIHQFMPTPVVAVDVWVKAGAIAEPEAWEGMAHFLEHMIFKGTERLAPGDFDRAIESCGGLTNAATSHDYAHYFITVSAQQLPQSLPHLAELLLRARIPAEEFERERHVVLEEIRQAQDDPDGVGVQALLEQLYGNHPYGRSVLGSSDRLLAQTPKDMEQFHRTYYQPEHMTVVMTGGIDYQDACTLLSQTFNEFVTPPGCPAPPDLDLPVSVSPRQTLHLPNLEYPRLLFGWRGPGTDNLREAIGLDIIATLLSGGRLSRLVQDLRETRQLVLDVQASYMLQREAGVFLLSVWLDEAMLEPVESAIATHLDDLCQTPIRAEELYRCQQLLCNDFVFSLETPSQLASLYGYYSVLDQLHTALDYPAQVRAWTPEQLQDLAKCYLIPGSHALTVMRSQPQ